MEEQSKLGQWLEERCQREHLTLRQAGARTGLSHATIAKVINGGTVSARTIWKLARGFGRDGWPALEDYLLVLAGYRTPEQPAEEAYLKVIPLLSPEHQHIVEALVGELANIEGVALPQIKEEQMNPSRRDEAVQLRKAGLSYAEIGRRLGISRERARQIVKVKPTPQKLALSSKVMLTTGDVAELLGLHPNTVRRWSEKGALKSYRIGPRGDRRFRREDVDGFLKEGIGGKSTTDS